MGRVQPSAPQDGHPGFNDLVTALPGRISRSVLADRLRKLEHLGLVARTDAAAYRLTPAGTGLLPTLLSLRGWAETWLPDDPAMVERDPDVVLAWLARRAAPHRLPHRPVTIEITTHHRHEHRARGGRGVDTLTSQRATG